MEMYKIVPLPEIERKTSWTHDQHSFIDDYGPSPRSQGSLDLCSKVDNLMSQFHSAKIMLSQTQLYNLEKVNNVYHDKSHAKSKVYSKSNQHHKHGKGKPREIRQDKNKLECNIWKGDSNNNYAAGTQINLHRDKHKTKHQVSSLQPLEVNSESFAYVHHKHISSNEPPMSSEFRETLQRWRSATRHFRQSSHKEQTIKHSFHNHIAMQWDNMCYSSGHEDEYHLDNQYQNNPEYGKGSFMFILRLLKVRCALFFQIFKQAYILL